MLDAISGGKRELVHDLVWSTIAPVNKLYEHLSINFEPIFS